MTYNVKGNVSQREGVWFPGVVADAIAAENADVIGLQEVCNWQLVDMVDRLGGQGWKYARHVTTVTGTNVCGGPAMEGAYGIGILSKLPLEDIEATALPVHNEARAVMSATIRPGGFPVRVFNTHLSPGAGLVQTAAVAQETAADSTPSKVLTGDLNVRHTETAALAPFADLSFREVDPQNRPTIDAAIPYAKIDYIWVSGPVAIDQAQVPKPPLEASDHLPLWADLWLGDRVEPPVEEPPLENPPVVTGRTDLRVRVARLAPRGRTLPGRQVRLRVTVANRGTAGTSGRVRVCLKAPGSRLLRVSGKKCRVTPALAPGAMARSTYVFRTTGRSAGRRLVLRFQVTSPGERDLSARTSLRVASGR